MLVIMTPPELPMISILEQAVKPVMRILINPKMTLIVSRLILISCNLSISEK